MNIWKGNQDNKYYVRWGRPGDHPEDREVICWIVDSAGENVDRGALLMMDGMRCGSVSAEAARRAGIRLNDDDKWAIS